MPGREQTERALSRLEEVRNMVREAEVEIRESAYYPPPELRRHLSQATSNLEAAEQALRTVLNTLQTSGRTPFEP